MFRVFGSLALLAFLLLPGRAVAHDNAAAPQLPKLSEKDEARLAAGKLVLRTDREGEEGSGLITGILDIQASKEKIWDILTNFEGIPETSAAMKEADLYTNAVVDGRGVVDVRYMLKVAWVEVVYHVHHDLFLDRDYLVWILDDKKENGIKSTVGSFSLWPGPGGKVRFLYQTSLQTGRRIPEWVEDELTESSLKRYILYVRKQAEK